MSESPILKKKRLRDKIEECSSIRRVERPYWNIIDHKIEETSAPANKYQRLELLKTLDSKQNDLPPKLRRLRRKLILKHLKEIEEPKKVVYENEASVGILKTIKYDSYIQCKFTDRTLKPIIYQNFDIKSPYLLMQDELLLKVQKKYPNLNVKLKCKRYPVNFVYIHHDHIAALKSLAELHFWPGIELTSALDYPEFSCIALYKRIIVGFGLMSPGEHLNDAYVSYLLVRPEWRKCGIATFILYHLTQTCMTWNITLHVSPTNQSTILYQKFGFKSHLLLRNFYDKYTPALSNQSKHAFYMKLDRH
ncbi:hypothetical protein O3M35_009392 [Rhynocoris fuscipes]|uniref:N-acetyltransferase domain-containing protein n=1 Tax=Rhynocoris fuscipes TaxID=488301 RepID=A0AAW1D5P9_9HEMI